MTFGHFIATSLFVFSLLCIVAVLFFERKNPASSLVWILALVFLPVVGFILYLFLGSGFRISKRKKYVMKAVSDDIYDNYVAKRLNLGHTRVFLKNHRNALRLLTYLKNEGEGFFTDNNDAKIYTGGEEMFGDLIQDIGNARHHVHLLFYIFRNDALGREIVALLEEKAKNGIEVRLIYDSVGTLMAFDTMFRNLKAAGGKVEAFSPLFSSLNSHLRLNYRNHRKIAVVDGQVGYVGGMNVGLEYMGKDKKLSPWRDTHLRIVGSAVWSLQERFLMDWCYSSETDPQKVDVGTYFPEPARTGDMAMQIASSGPDTFESPIKSGMLSMLYAAKKSIYIQTPYFAPDESFTDALRIAARSNVDVRLMLPQVSDYQIVQMTTLGYAREMLQYGVGIHLYKGFIHAKTVVVDGLVASIGTTNITNRSFTLDFEINAFVYNQAFAEACDAIFHRDEENCIRLPGDYFEKKNAFVRAGYNFARLFAPMM